MTLHLSLEDVSAGRLDSLAPYTVPEGGSAGAMRWGSSVLPLEAGDSAVLLTLQRAAAVVSANDAAWTLALLSSGGDAGSFIERMNTEARRLGMTETRYMDPDGWSSLSETTGKDQLALVLAYLRAHPSALGEIHSLEALEYRPGDSVTASPGRKNTNLLLGKYEGVDGLKTGAHPAECFHFIATARRDGTRIIAVVMGIESDDFREGLIRRAREARDVLDWSFRRYETWYPKEPSLPPIRVRHGVSEASAVMVGELPEPRTLGKGDADRVIEEVEMDESVTAPAGKGTPVGRILWTLDGETLDSAAVLLSTDQERRWRLRDFLGMTNREKD